jgi:hypothetical protein
MTMRRTARAGATLLAALCFLGLGTQAHAASAQGAVSVDLIRAVRVADTSVTLSFRTDEESIGSVEYASVLGEDRTLTDSVQQTDHVFTLDGLDPAHAYTFTLRAERGSDASYIYTILLAPEDIGATGQSLMPQVQVTSEDGTVIATIAAASSTPAIPSHTDGALILVLLVIIAGICWYVASRRKRSKPEDATRTEAHL